MRCAKSSGTAPGALKANGLDIASLFLCKILESAVTSGASFSEYARYRIVSSKRDWSPDKLVDERVPQCY